MSSVKSINVLMRRVITVRSAVSKLEMPLCLAEYSKDEFDNTVMKNILTKICRIWTRIFVIGGAELIADDTTSATFCIYCKSAAIIKSRFSGRFKPKSVIPFKLTKEQAKQIYSNWIHKRILAPKEFKQKRRNRQSNRYICTFLAL